MLRFSELRVGVWNEHHMRHRQNGEFEAHLVDFSQFTELNVVRAVMDHLEIPFLLLK